MSEKVYCIDCQWFRRRASSRLETGGYQPNCGHCVHDVCFQQVDLPSEISLQRIRTGESRVDWEFMDYKYLNRNNDCACFTQRPKRKWWKRWA